MSGIDEAYSRFKAAESLFRCPVCASGLTFMNRNSLVCAENHCFDLSKRGYINFAPAQGAMKYTKELFHNRREIFRSGFYAPLTERLGHIIDGHCRNSNILDAGCGEGFFSSALSEGHNMLAMDILKDAVIMASSDKNIKWLVGDLANIPLRSGSMDIVLNILAPANYGEFLRVMGGGTLIKVVPGSRYLIELRELSAKSPEYSNEDVLRRFCENIRLQDTHKLCYRLPVTARQAESLVKMTPLLLDTDAVIDPRDIKQITIDVEILVGAAL